MKFLIVGGGSMGKRRVRCLLANRVGPERIRLVDVRANRREECRAKHGVEEEFAGLEAGLEWDSARRVRLRARGDAPAGVPVPGNPPAAALSTSMVSDPFLIDNTPPRIASLSASATSGMLHATWRAADALSDIKKAEYSLDGGDWTLAAPVTALSDSHELAYDLTLDHIAPGEHTLAVRVEDDYDNQSVDKVVTEPRP